MNEPLNADLAPAPTTAGGLLRRARQAQGLHIAALAAAIKVVPRKLELLESDQFDQLPDATFTRALAHTVCRTLKIDAAPVLALLPPPNGHRLEQVAVGLNTPFRERPGLLVPKEWAIVTTPVLWLAAVILIGALLVYFAPSNWLQKLKPSATTSGPAAATVDAPAAAEEPTSAGVPLPSEAAAAAADLGPSPAPVAAETPESVTAQAASAVPAAAPGSGVLQLHATAASWVGVIDAHGQSLIAREMKAGEDVAVDGAIPFKVRIGNAVGTQLVFRGQPLELAAYTRDNVARLELK
jgi:cytoskeleton protein RodZ